MNWLVIVMVVLAVWVVFAIGFATAMLMVMSKRMDQQTERELQRSMVQGPAAKPLHEYYPPAKVPESIRKYAKKLDQLKGRDKP